MAEEKKSFVLYKDYQKHLEKLSDEQAGQLIKAIFTYVNDQEIYPMDDTTEMAFSFIQMQLERDVEKYREICKKRKEAIEKRWNKENKSNTKSTNVYKSNTKNTNVYKSNFCNTKDTDNDTVNDNVNGNVNDTDTVNDINNININTNSASDDTRKVSKGDISEFFEKVWVLYPNKKGKGQISDAKKKVLYEIGIDEITRAIERYKSDLAKEEWRKPQNGSTFFNSGYLDYLDSNYTPVKEQKPRNKFNNFNQRSYESDALERMLLERQKPVERVDDDPILKAEADELRKILQENY